MRRMSAESLICLLKIKPEIYNFRSLTSHGGQYQIILVETTASMGLFRLIKIRLQSEAKKGTNTSSLLG